MSEPADVEIRELRTFDELLSSSALTRATWGADDAVPATLLQAIQKMEGLAAGAFAGTGEMVGTVVGMSGRRRGRRAHWSHMLAVAPAWRDRGLGRRLKLFQRRWALDRGIRLMHWSYDPLESRNNHLNLNLLGAEVAELVPDFYGPGRSELHRVIGTDRFLVDWHLDGERACRALAGEPPSLPAGAAEAPLVTLDGAPGELPAGTLVRLEIPADVQALKHSSPEAAVAWRRLTRRAFQHYLPRGYAVAGFYRQPASGRSFFVLRREDRGGPTR